MYVGVLVLMVVHLGPEVGRRPKGSPVLTRSQKPRVQLAPQHVGASSEERLGGEGIGVGG